MANTKFETQEGSNENTGFLNGKNRTPPKIKAIKQDSPQTKTNQTKRQTQSKTPVPPEERTHGFIN
jgi:hypothetical protein